jgi:hypothetical protein
VALKPHFYPYSGLLISGFRKSGILAFSSKAEKRSQKENLS